MFDLLNLPYESQKKIMTYLGKIYRRSNRRMDVMSYGNSVKEPQALYDSDLSLVHIIDKVLEDCTTHTRNIVRHEYLEQNDTCWYEAYYARSTYYAMKKKAVAEFLDKLVF